MLPFHYTSVQHYTQRQHWRSPNRVASFRANLCHSSASLPKKSYFTLNNGYLYISNLEHTANLCILITKSFKTDEPDIQRCFGKVRDHDLFVFKIFIYLSCQLHLNGCIFVNKLPLCGYVRSYYCNLSLMTAISNSCFKYKKERLSIIQPLNAIIRG